MLCVCVCWFVEVCLEELDNLSDSVITNINIPSYQGRNGKLAFFTQANSYSTDRHKLKKSCTT